jgi:hypothetical protein
MKTIKALILTGLVLFAGTTFFLSCTHDEGGYLGTGEAPSLDDDLKPSPYNPSGTESDGSEKGGGEEDSSEQS